MNRETRNIITSSDKAFKGTIAFVLAATIGATSFAAYNFHPKPVEAKEVMHIDLAKEREIYLYKKATRIKALETQVASVEVKAEPAFQPINADFTTYDLTNPSHLTASQIDQIIAGTELEGLGWAYEQAEEQFGVNALYLIAHSALESGWGKSRIAESKNNLFGFQAYDASPGQSAKKFQTKGDCILTVAGYISRQYLEENGEHYNGSTLRGMGQKYASDDEWAIKIAEIMGDIQQRVEKV